MMIRENVLEQGLVADLFHDGTGRPRKAIILVGGSEGGKAWSSIGTKKAVTDLTGLGYTLLSLGYFLTSHPKVAPLRGFFTPAYCLGEHVTYLRPLAPG